MAEIETGSPNADSPPARVNTTNPLWTIALLLTYPKLTHPLLCLKQTRHCSGKKGGWRLKNRCTACWFSVETVSPRGPTWPVLCSNPGRVDLLNMRYASPAAALVGVVAASSGSIVGEAFLAAPSLQTAHGRSTSPDDKNDELTFAPSAAPTTAALPRRQRRHALAGCAIGIQTSPLAPRSPPATGAARKRVSGHRRARPTGTAPCVSAAADEGGDGGVLGPLRPLSPTEDGSDVFNPNPLDRSDPERARVSGSLRLSTYVSRSLLAHVVSK